MGASSVTGVGLGVSNGLYKPELHCGGCGCCGKPTETTPSTPVKLGCFSRIRVSNMVRYSAGGLNNSIKVC